MYIDRLCSLEDVDVDASFLSPFSTVCDIGTGLQTLQVQTAGDLDVLEPVWEEYRVDGWLGRWQFPESFEVSFRLFLIDSR